MYEVFDFHVAVRPNFGKQPQSWYLDERWYLVKTSQKIMILQLPYW